MHVVSKYGRKNCMYSIENIFYYREEFLHTPCKEQQNCILTAETCTHTAEHSF